MHYAYSIVTNGINHYIYILYAYYFSFSFFKKFVTVFGLESVFGTNLKNKNNVSNNGVYLVLISINLLLSNIFFINLFFQQYFNFLFVSFHEKINSTAIFMRKFISLWSKKIFPFFALTSDFSLIRSKVAKRFHPIEKELNPKNYLNN